ncbi:MAG: hypothetical protein Q8P76_02460 [bacterium]|nr:hypothetical protein [bacterium]
MAQRFYPLLEEALEVGLETTVLAEDANGISLPEGFLVRNPNDRGNKPNAKTVSLTHPGTVIHHVPNVMAELLIPTTEAQILRVIHFHHIPPGIKIQFQRLNFRQSPNRDFTGLICGRSGEAQAFPIRQRDNSPYANLDFFSKTKEWNPLFVKYRRQTPLKDAEFGYLEIQAGRIPPKMKNTEDSYVIVARVPESAVPEFLRTAQTFPK